MRFHTSLLAGAVLAAASLSAGAQTSGTVAIGGQLLTTSCTIALTNGGVYNVGTIAAAALDPTATTDRALITQTVTMACSGPTLLSLSASDNRDGTALGTTSHDFGLGNAVASSAPIGHYKIAIPGASILIDGVVQPVLHSADNTTWATATPAWWHKAQSTAAKYRAFGATTPTAFTNASFVLEVHPTLNSRNALLLTAAETIDGSATLTVHYL